MNLTLLFGSLSPNLCQIPESFSDQLITKRDSKFFWLTKIATSVLKTNISLEKHTGSIPILRKFSSICLDIFPKLYYYSFLS